MLSESVNRIVVACENLAARTECIRSATPPCDPCKEPLMSFSAPLASAIRDESSKVDQARDLLEIILSTLEV